MEMSPADPRRDLETIRTLMERARHYRHPPVSAALAASALGLAGAFETWRALQPNWARLGTFLEGADPSHWVDAASDELRHLGLVWGGVFLAALVSCIALTFRSARKEGMPIWSPLAKDVLHALWPPLAAALVLTAALVRAGAVELVPSVWLLCYGIGGVAAGGYARGIVRGLGLAFVAAGVGSAAYPHLEPWLVLGATFGGLHLIYAAALVALPRS